MMVGLLTSLYSGTGIGWKTGIGIWSAAISKDYLYSDLGEWKNLDLDEDTN